MYVCVCVCMCVRVCVTITYTVVLQERSIGMVTCTTKSVVRYHMIGQR